ncbi:hypothetical protein C8T65DRAFT_700693 [Cerioporus squamosus]|nr:hypothetical protein C8T65DRAFT_700693 [Cerioporus squamosus]
MSRLSSTVVKPPLDDLFNQPSASDITLRSSDHFDLHVHSQILSQASPIFSTMLLLPRPHAGGQTARQQDASDLAAPKEALIDFDSIILVLKAALKYEIAWPVRLLERDLVAIVPHNPLSVWAIAARCGLEELASKAASEIRARSTSLKKPALDVLSTMLEADKHACLEGVSAADHFRLREWLQVPEQAQFKLLSRAFPQRNLAALVRRMQGVPKQVEAAKAQARQVTPKLSSMEELDGPPTEIRSPMLDLNIDPITLYHLLDVCYNRAERLPPRLRCLASLIAASEKLEMTQVYALADAAWQEAASANPLEAYFVALQHKLDSRAKAAARKVLEMPVKGWYVGAMESSPAMAYQHLLDYYEACVRSVQEQFCKAAELHRTRMERQSRDVNADPAIISDRLRELGRRAEAEGPIASGMHEQLSLPALFRLTCVQRQATWHPRSSWPEGRTAYCHDLVETMLGIASILQSLPDIVAQVELNVA